MWKITGLDFEESLFSSKLRGKKRKTIKRASVTVSVTCGSERLPHSHARTLTCFAFFPTDFRGKERLLAVYYRVCINKINSNLASVQRRDHRERNCKIGHCFERRWQGLGAEMFCFLACLSVYSICLFALVLYSLSMCAFQKLIAFSR